MLYVSGGRRAINTSRPNLPRTSSRRHCLVMRHNHEHTDKTHKINTERPHAPFEAQPPAATPDTRHHRERSQAKSHTNDTTAVYKVLMFPHSYDARVNTHRSAQSKGHRRSNLRVSARQGAAKYSGAPLRNSSRQKPANNLRKSETHAGRSIRLPTPHPSHTNAAKYLHNFPRLSLRAYIGRDTSQTKHGTTGGAIHKRAKRRLTTQEINTSQSPPPSLLPKNHASMLRRTSEAATGKRNRGYSNPGRCRV